jgi:small-conductance mechanosensitive channel
VNGSPLGDLLDAVAQGMVKPHHAWQAGVIAFAMLAAVLLSRTVRSRVEARLIEAASESIPVDLLQFSIEGARRLAFPAAALLLLWVGEGLLRVSRLGAGPADLRLLRLAMALVGVLALVRVVVYGLRRTLANVQLIAAFERSIALLAWIGSALYVTGVLSDVVDWLEGTVIPVGRASVSLWSIIAAVTTTGVCLLGAMWIGSLIDARLAREAGLDRNVRFVLGRISRAMLILVSLLLALALSGIDLTVLSVFGGALGVGLGLGLQRIASSYVSGFILLLDRSLRIGDLITVDKYYGTVAQINTRYTLLRGLDGTDTVIPNEMLVSSPVVNHSLTDRFVRLTVRVAVDYGVDVEQALKVGTQAAASTPRVVQDPPPMTLLVEFAADGLLLEVAFWVSDPENGRLNVQSDVAVNVYRLFSAAGIGIPFPRRDIRILDTRTMAGQVVAR